MEWKALHQKRRYGSPSLNRQQFIKSMIMRATNQVPGHMHGSFLHYPVLVTIYQVPYHLPDRLKQTNYVTLVVLKDREKDGWVGAKLQISCG